MGKQLDGKLVVLVGGSGFVGRHLAQDLLARGARLRIAARHPEKAFAVKPLANLGQMQAVRCDVTRPDSLRAAIAGADAVVYLAGTFGAGQKQVQGDGPRIAAEAAAAAGAEAFVLVSSLSADAGSEGGYASSKAAGEEGARQAFPQATIMRPSVIFGQDDQFVTMFAGLVSSMPALPVFGPQAKLQPVFVDDVAAAITAALEYPALHGGKTYELAGPQVLTMLELHEMIAQAQGRERMFVPVPDALSALFAALPGTPMSSDQWTMLKAGNVATGTLPGLAKLGVEARPLSLFLDKWMVRFRKHGRFSVA
ncbi:complex I NDUFA9 subunit family protein [Alteraurantiacibacter buctensis]|uniref:NAD(P)H-binding protein n=1 Tax=Alteraurantiacibacter buctensis TaxID=1503981 RepID=A0A844YW64_9SPHN|nr:complex I NDUFA9 subunit family protein [Alteraurantiacibacter buctensis]MXO71071.1 NAD(P)H-binding protein [Alteraurantiacibacter buctensis]